MISNSNLLQKVQSSSFNTSLKVVAEGTSSISVITFSSGSYASGMTPIPHTAQTDQLIWQVAMFSNLETEGNNIPTPYQSDDSRTVLHSYVDTVNLYVEAAYSSSTNDLVPFTIQFYYRVLAP